jgi:hypothetical protein
VAHRRCRPARAVDDLADDEQAIVIDSEVVEPDDGSATAPVV